MEYSVNPSEKYWYLITTKPNQDHRAEVNLTNQGYVVYRPLARISRTQNAHVSFKLESLFPRYIFIQLDTETDNWSPIRSTFGVAGFVKFGLYPYRVSDELVAYVRQHERDYEQKAIAFDEFSGNDQIKVTGGAFEGYDAIFKEYDGERRAIILLDFLGRQRQIKVPASILKLI